MRLDIICKHITKTAVSIKICFQHGEAILPLKNRNPSVDHWKNQYIWFKLIINVHHPTTLIRDYQHNVHGPLFIILLELTLNFISFLQHISDIKQTCHIPSRMQIFSGGDYPGICTCQVDQVYHWHSCLNKPKYFYTVLLGGVFIADIMVAVNP